MSLAGLHARRRGSGGKYDDFIDFMNSNVPGAQQAGQKWLDFHASNPEAETAISGYIVLDLATNGGDATLGGVAGLVDDDALQFLKEAGDPIGNPIQLAGGGAEEVGERVGLENLASAGDFFEGIGHFLSSGSDRPEFWEGMLDGEQPAEPDNSTDHGGMTTTSRGDTTRTAPGETTATEPVGEHTTTATGDLDYTSDSAPFDDYSEQELNEAFEAISAGGEEPLTREDFLNDYKGVQEIQDGEYAMVLEGYEIDLGHLDEEEREFLESLSPSEAYDLFEESEYVE